MDHPNLGVVVSVKAGDHASLHIRQVRGLMKTSFTKAVVMAALLSACAAGHAASLNVSLDTSALSGSQATLAFDFLAGDGGLTNTATIGAFNMDGVLGGVVGLAGNVAGDLSSGVTLSTPEFFNEIQQSVTLGSHLSFALNVTENTGGTIPDEFSFTVLDQSGTSSLYSTSDPQGMNALMRMDIGIPVTASSYSGNLQLNSVSSVPEPSSFALVVSCLALFVVLMPRKFYQRSIR